jgi:hypothetical protein
VTLARRRFFTSPSMNRTNSNIRHCASHLSNRIASSEQFPTTHSSAYQLTIFSRQASASPNPAPTSTPDASPGDILGGLGGLLKQFQQNGLGDAINSWINTGRTRLSQPIRSRMHWIQTSSTLSPSARDSLRIRSCEFCRRFFRTQSTSLRLKDVYRPGRRLHV